MRVGIPIFVTFFVVVFAVDACAAGVRLEHYEYPFPVEMFVFKSQKQDLEMAYMDLKPEGGAKGVVVLLHGKNFSGAYWEETAKALSAIGYRVLMPDQIGFGKSSKPEHYHQLKSYYDGKWQPKYDPWVELLADSIESPDYPLMAWNQALTYDMIVTQPVCHEFSDLAVPTLLIIGQRDRTAIGRNTVAPELAEKLGNYPELGRETDAVIPDSKLVEIDGIGHLPHIEAFPRFIKPLKEFLVEQTQP